TAHDNQKYVTVKVLQGESRLARNNLKIGELSVEVPPGPKGQEAIEITYTYDVNSLLEVEVRVVSTGLEKKIIIQSEENRMSEEEAAERMKVLSYLKLNPRDDEQNTLTLLRAERFYEEALGPQKETIGQAIDEFDQGDYEASGASWQKVMRENGNYDLAYIGIGRALMRQEKYKEALKYFELKYDRDNYSKAFKQYRKIWVEEHIGIIVFVILALFLVPMTIGRTKRIKHEIDTADIFNKDR
ncbi:MAG: Hsp70 family protein, partial [Lachnospiraceae bacterium]|nr:Hsp70 family protein [Lachnospiraceae bacterium]